MSPQKKQHGSKRVGNRKQIATAADLEEMVRLGLIDSPEEVTRKLLAEEEEARASAGDTERGRKLRLAAKRGGRPKGSIKAEKVLAEFKRRRPKTPPAISNSRLAEIIGREIGLRKRASIIAIRPAKKPRSKPV
jgi:hypothetical protein